MNYNSSMIFTQLNQNFFIQKLVVNPYATLADITSGCVLAAVEEFQSLLFNAILKIHIAGIIISRKRAAVNYAVGESGFPEIITEEKKNPLSAITKIDMKNYDDVKLVEHAGGKGKKGGKKGDKRKSKKGVSRNLEEEKAAQRKKEEEERLKKWNEDWEKKLNAQEALDEIPCCSAEGLCLKPKTQSNIWIKVTQDKQTQNIQMAFMHVPVPRPKAPPLPKLVKIETAETPPPVTKNKKGGQKKGKGKKK